MAFPSRLIVVRNFSNLGVDILVFVATEILVRLMLSDRNAARWKIPLLAIQGVILLAISSLLAFLHHFPYLLAFITFFLFIKLAVFVSGRVEQGNSAVSRPLRYTSDISDVDEFEIDSVNPKRQQIGSVSSATVSSQPGVNSLRQRTESLQHTGSQQQSKPKDVSTTSLCKTSEVLQKPNAPSNLSITHNQLHRSPLTSSLPQPTLWTMSSRDEQSSDPSLCQHPTLGYFTSFLNFQKPSSTPPGLINVGNTCFLNSILQCLTWTVGFVEVLPLVSPVDDGTSEFVRNLNTVVHRCHVLPDGVSRFEPIDPSGLLISLSKLAPHLVVDPESRRHQSQQDAAECLLWVLDSLHGILLQSDSRSDRKEPLLSAMEISVLTNRRAACLAELEKETSDNSPSFKQCLATLSEVDWELYWQRNSSSIYELFLGQLVEARQCQLCNKMSVNVEYFTVLLLPVPSLAVNDTTHVFKLQDCFEKFSKVEDLVKGNMLHCSCTLSLQDKLTTLTPGRRLALLSRPPKRLVIQLTRFSYDSLRKEALKNTALVTFPLTLDLYPHTMQAKLNPSLQQTNLYHLCAFCVHTGAQSTSFGHYVAYCKADNHQWYYCNDKNVRRIANIVTEMNTSFVLQNAYLLFYALQD